MKIIPQHDADDVTPVDSSAVASVPRDDHGGSGFRLGYRRWLDGLRGLAVLAVLAFHLGFLPGGSLGVDIFFVLSGFLITALLVEEWQCRGAISLKAFYLRRALRLLPAFFTLLVVLMLGSLWMHSPEQARGLRSEVIVAGCYIADWPALHQTAMPFLGHTWSLSVEEQFYLLWPLLLAGMLRRKWSHRQILLVVCAGILACVFYRMGLYRLYRTTGPVKTFHVLRLYMGLDTRADTLLVGCLVGLLASWNFLPRSQRAVLWVGVGSLASLPLLIHLALYRCLDHSSFYHGLFTGVATMVGLIIVHMLLRPSRLGSLLLDFSPLVYVGRLSYAIYLFHVPVIAWLQPTGLGWQHPSATLMVVGLTGAAAVASYYCIERPCLRLRDSLSRRRPTTRANESPSADRSCLGGSPERVAA